jgi:hypothetical protein
MSHSENEVYNRIDNFINQRKRDIGDEVADLNDRLDKLTLIYPQYVIEEAFELVDTNIKPNMTPTRAAILLEIKSVAANKKRLMEAHKKLEKLQADIKASAGKIKQMPIIIRYLEEMDAVTTL